MDWAIFATFMAASAAAAATGALFQPGDWYLALRKPWWTPPGWLFPIVWTTLYICISVAAARVAALPQNEQALAFWALQIALNALWTPVFFGLHRLRAALAVLICLWLAVAATLLAFLAIDFTAGALFTPYLLWVSIAGTLNFTIVRMNPATRG